MQNPETISLDATFNVRNRLHDLAIWQEAAQTQANLIRTQVAAMDVNANKSEIHKAIKLNIRQSRLKRNFVQIPLELKPEVVGMLGYQKLRRHLVSQFALLSVEERLLWLENLSFVITPDLRHFTDLLSYYLSPYRYEQKNVLLGGPSGMGKTFYLEWLASNFLHKNEGLRYQIPFVFVDAPVGQSSKMLLQRILLACGKRYHDQDTEVILLIKIAGYFRMLGVNGLIIDDIAHLQAPNVLRCLHNLEVNFLHFNRIPIVGASCDPHIWREANKENSGRWNGYFRLEPYTGSRLQQLLSLINLILPFPEDSFVDLRLHNQSVQDFSVALPISSEAYFIQKTTQGTIREMMLLIITASKEAIKQELTCLSLDLLQRTWQQLHCQL